LYGDAKERMGNGLLSLQFCCAFSSQNISQVHVHAFMLNK